MSQVGKWSLGSTRLILNHTKRIRHFNQRFSVTAPLHKRHHHDTREVILIFLPEFFFTEVSHKVIAIILNIAEHIEEETFNCIVNILMI